MAKNIVTLDVQGISPGEGSAPGTLTGIDVDSGQELRFKAWGEMLSQFTIGKSFKFEWYLGKEYKGIQDMCVSKHGDVSEVPSAAGNGIQSPIQAPPARKPAAEVPPPPRNTPQGVMGAAQGTRERSIVAQAIIKSVIGVVGTPADVQKWVDVHDAIVAGKRVD
jgi:hypothetical protein